MRSVSDNVGPHGLLVGMPVTAPECIIVAAWLKLVSPFLRGPSPFTGIAGKTSRNDVFRRVSTAAGNGDNVILSHGNIAASAVCAAIFMKSEDRLPLTCSQGCEHSGCECPSPLLYGSKHFRMPLGVSPTRSPRHFGMLLLISLLPRLEPFWVQLVVLLNLGSDFFRMTLAVSSALSPEHFGVPLGVSLRFSLAFLGIGLPPLLDLQPALFGIFQAISATTLSVLYRVVVFSLVSQSLLAVPEIACALACQVLFAIQPIAFATFI